MGSDQLQKLAQAAAEEVLCHADGHYEGAKSIIARCLQQAVAEVERERDQYRAQVNAVANVDDRAMGRLESQRDALAAALREIAKGGCYEKIIMPVVGVDTLQSCIERGAIYGKCYCCIAAAALAEVEKT